MKRLCFAFCMLAAGSIAAYSSAAVAEPRAVIELFTSQGCSSCPPADKLLGELAKDPSLVAVSLPIDYWDYLGWKDTLARPRHTARQRGYASARGDREVYTPQAVVNGVAHVVGSDRNAIEDAIARTRGHGGLLSVPVKLSFDDARLTVKIKPPKESEVVAEVWLCTLSAAIPVAIGRGENRGRKVTYHNVARRWVKLGVWTGGTQTWSVARSEFQTEEIDTIAVIVQAGGMESPGGMLGAATASLR